MNVTKKQLQTIMPNATQSDISIYLTYINTYAPQFSITTDLRMAHFLAQIAVESNELRYTSENLMYSASRLTTVFPKYFTSATARTYAYHPQKIANRIYANRYGNGNEASGDGYRYRGRGLIQVTFKANYKAYSDYLTSHEKQNVDLITNPDLLEKPKGAVKSAMWIFQKFGCNELADKNDVEAVRRKINGGTNGLLAAKKYLSRAINMKFV